MDKTVFNIRCWLKEAGISQVDIARMLRITPVAVNNVISGKRRTPRIRKAISMATGRPESELWPENKEAA
jgi:predicted XRE-type DNA-binding protein